MTIRISASKLQRWQTCPFSYYLAYIRKEKTPKWIRALFGVAVHRTIAGFYRLNENQRSKRIRKKQTQLVPQTKKSAIGLWIHNWQRIIEETGKENIRFDLGKDPEEQIQELLRLGASMIGKYWQDNYNAPFPVAVEKRFSITLPGITGVTLVGSIDQIRKISDEWWLLDLKTGRQDYGLEDARFQYPVHHSYQFTIYSLAFRMLYDEEETGIIRYPLGYKKKPPITGRKVDKSAIITPRTIDDYLDLVLLIITFLRNCDLALYPKNYGDHCRFCDYLEICANWKRKSVPLPVGKLNWGKINPNRVIAELEEIAHFQRVKQPRLL